MWKIFKRRAAAEAKSIVLAPPLITTCFTRIGQAVHLGIAETWTTLCSHEYVQAGRLVLASEVQESVIAQSSAFVYCVECVEILTGIAVA